MASQFSSQRILRFGVFEVDLQGRELRKSGLKLKVHEQPFQVLAALLERPGEVVTREELRQKIWPADTFVDFDHSINTAVNKLREVLGDSADNPRFVETLARRGYRFLGPVDGAEAEAVATLAPEAAIEGNGQRAAAAEISAVATGARLRKREWLAWMLAVCLFASLIAALTVNRLRPPQDAPTLQFEVALPEKLGPICPGPVVSPDGQYVAIVLGNESQSRIWLHSMRSLATIPLPGTEGGNFLFWSPDSRQIGFSTGSTLQRISIAGGPPQVICDLSSNGPGAWNPGGVILFSPGDDQPLYEVGAKGGKPSELTKLDRTHQEFRHWFPQFLPDGRHFIFRVRTNSGDLTYVGSLDSRGVKRIDNAADNAVYAAPDHLIFTIGQSLMAQRLDVRTAELAGDPMALAESPLMWDEIRGYERFSVSENGVLTYLRGSAVGSGGIRTQLAWFDRTGKRLGGVGEPAEYSNPAISPNGKKVAVAKEDPQTKTRDIWVIDLQRGTNSRLTFDPSDDTNPAWSPDGTRIAFTSERKGHRDIYVKPASGSGEEQIVLESNENKSVEHWSSDGQYLLWGTNTQEWLFSFKEQKSLPLPKFTQDQGSFCPSGSGPPRWFAYASGETGTWQVYVRSLTGALSGSGGKWQISTNGGIEPNWRGDGKELFYVSGNKLMAVEVNPDGESFQFGVSKQLFETPLPPAGLRNRYDVTSDGKRFLINAPVDVEKAPQSFRVVLNWQALLRR